MSASKLESRGQPSRRSEGEDGAPRKAREPGAAASAVSPLEDGAGEVASRSKGNHPIYRTGLMSWITYQFMQPLISLGSQRPLQPADCFPVCEDDSAEFLGGLLSRAWDEELASRPQNPSFLRAMLRSVARRSAKYGLAGLVQACARVAQTQFLAVLLRWFVEEENGGASAGTGYLYGTALVLCGLVIMLTHHQFFFGGWRCGLQLRTAATAMVYKKSVSLRLNHDFTTGEVTNIASNDIERFQLFGSFMHFLWIGPIECTAIIVLLWQQVGAASLAGVAAVVLLIPLQTWFSKRFGAIRRHTAVLTDERVKLTNQVVSGSRIVKMYAWEEPYAGLIKNARHGEYQYILKSSMYRGANAAIFFCSSTVVGFLVFSVYYWATDDLLTAEIVFTTLSLFNNLQLMATNFVPLALQSLVEARVSAKRIQRLLMLPEFEGSPEGGEGGKGSGAAPGCSAAGVEGDTPGGDGAGPPPADDAGAGTSTMTAVGASGDGGPLPLGSISFRDAVCSWEVGGGERGEASGAAGDEDGDGGGIGHASSRAPLSLDAAANDDDNDDSRPRAFALRGLNFTTAPGSLTIVAGPVGSGKSTALLAMLGEVRARSGAVRVRGRVSFVSQSPYIFSGTVRDNICFGLPFDADRYLRVVNACALAHDLRQLPRGDRTVVGERGVGLSGGQQARLGLARAVYREADVYLLDDPLSAVDPRVAKHLFDQCICGFLSGKTRVLVTHQVQFLARADRTLVLVEGRQLVFGTHSDLVASGVNLAAVAHHAGGAGGGEAGGGDEALAGGDKGGGGSGGGSGAGAGAGASAVGAAPPAPITLDDVTVVDHTDVKRAAAVAASAAGDAGSDVGRDESGDVASEVAAEVEAGALGRGRSLSGASIPALHALQVSRQQSSVGGAASVSVSVSLGVGRVARSRMPSDGSLGRASSLAEGEEAAAEEEAEEVLRDHFESMGEIDAIAAVADAHVGGAPEDMVREEERRTGMVGLSTLAAYARAAGGWCTTVTVLTVFLIGQLLFMASSWWLSELSTMDRQDQEEEVNYTIYAVLVGATVFIAFLRSLVFFAATVRASRVLHDRMLDAVLRAPMSFFDSNPVMNRFSKDLGLMDDMVPWTMQDFAFTAAMVAGAVVLVCAFNPWVFLAFLPLLFTFVYLRRFFMRTAREVKRIEATSRSPVFSLLGETLASVVTVRAFGLRDHFVRRFWHFQNENTRAYFLFILTSRWLGFRLDSLSVVFLAITTYLALVARDAMDAGTVGLSLSYTMMLTGLFQWCVRQSAEVESLLVSVERVNEYTDLPREGEWEREPTPPKEWPAHGAIEFRDVRLRYRPDLEPVLDGLTFDIRAGEKVAIVGRTGSGKSTLATACLFRLVNCEAGEIRIDGVPILGLGLHQLRSQLSVIPQDPVLFAGTLRNNLDPFGRHSDEAIWRALEEVQLKDQVTALPGGLQAPMHEGGSNLSVGTRQLVCLCRAILRASRVLVLDEASANVDVDTDGRLQAAIRRLFRDNTVLTVAHRLGTIIDADRVLVMDKGRVVEFDAPHVLLERSDSAFTGMVRETGAVAEQELREAALRAYEARKASEGMAIRMK